MAFIPFSKIFKSFYKGEGIFKPKNIPVTQESSQKMNQFYGGGNTDNFTWTNKPELRQHYEKLYEQFASSNPFIPSPVAMKNPIKRRMEEEMYARKAVKYCLENEPKEFPQMLYKGAYGQKADTKPRQGASVASSWITSVKIDSPSQVTVKFNGKNGAHTKTFSCSKTNQAKWLQDNSIGEHVSNALHGNGSILS